MPEVRLPRSTRFSILVPVEPDSLTLAVGASAVVTITVYRGSGETLDRNTAGWVVEGGENSWSLDPYPALRLTRLDAASANPQRIRVEALTPAADTLDLIIGISSSTCADPPLCFLQDRHWQGLGLPRLRVPVRAQ